MTILELDAAELTALVSRVFQPRAEDRAVAVLVDLPDDAVPDTPSWRARREIAAGWVDELRSARAELGLEVEMILYRNVRRNNADLPSTAWRHGAGMLPASADDLEPEAAVPFDEILAERPLILAPTQFSATAPLKVSARRHGFRAATMPGFSPAMVPALRIDYTEVNRRVRLLKELLDRAESADLVFAVNPNADHASHLTLHLDLRHRTAHASGGLLPEPGTAGNLPSGEAYIVPYEGEVSGDPSHSAGVLPVQHDDEVVLYRITANRAVSVAGGGPAAAAEAEHIAREPAYGNLAELGLGVLDDFGIEPIGEVLLDEKLGLHVAFGRSDHFGGRVGPGDFSAPEEVVHQDHVYVPALQPRVAIARASLTMADGTTFELMRDSRYVVDFGSGS